MKIKLDDIEAFCIVAEHESFREAAKILSITPSGLSRRLIKLEEALGAQLLDRTTRQVSISTVGKEFLPEAQRIVASFQKIIEEMQDRINVRSGSVSVATNMTIADTILPKIIQVFRKQNPSVRVHVMESSSPKALVRVLNQECEFGIAQFGEGDPGLGFEVLLEDYFVLLCHRDHPLARSKEITWADLNGLNFIHLQSLSGTMGILKRTLGEQIHYLKGDITVGHFNALLGLIGENIGISAIPSTVKLKRPDLHLVTRPIKSPVVSRKLGIVTKNGKSLSPAGKALAGFCRKVIKQHFPE